MDTILQKRLFDAFPKIFQEKDLPMQQTCMCWGISTDDGWFNLLYRLCEHLQWHTDKNKFPQVIANQVKEKYGTLRFYYTLDVEEFEDKNDIRLNQKCSEHGGAIQFAEALSARICEICGQFDDTVELKVRGGWYKTLCTVCAEPSGYEKIIIKEDEV
jgi:hypothetical protein